ncbi:MAG: sigma-70 family RNA polymerase sigma factor [Firmicutes bacterium]|nr:sigma-70 family RNA polymerase sigma factor [Bacillota bacterium]
MDDKDRKRLIEENILLVRFVMSRIKGGFPEGMTEEDIYQEGCIGLIHAVDHYSEDKGPFATYACHRIRGAILDGAIRYQWMIKKRDVRNSQSESPVVLGLIPEIISAAPESEEEEFPDHAIMEITDEQLNLYDAMDHLEPIERAMIREHYFEGQSLTEIARMKRMNYYIVRSFHARAIRKLKNRLI